ASARHPSSRCSARASWAAPSRARARAASIACEELQHQPVDLRRVLVRRPVSGGRDAMDVGRAANGGADLVEQQIGGAKRRVVADAPQHADRARGLGQIAEQRTTGAHLAAVEPRATYAL